jgi:hypothetical protein
VNTQAGGNAGDVLDGEARGRPVMSSTMRS